MSEFTIWERLQIAWAAFRRVGGIDLPDSGRSSVEDLKGRMSASIARYSTISPVVDFEMLKCLRDFWIFNPDFSQYVHNIQNLGNTGHEVVVDARSEAAAEAALERINETASRVYRNGAGVDGLMNAYFAQIAWSGALSSEDVVNFPLRRVEQTVIVPVLDIRFKWNDELQQYEPHQRTNTFKSDALGELGLVPLHPETYKYFALQTIENSPYAKPPASAAIDAITNSQKPILDNIAYIAQKFGLMGLFTAQVTPPPKKPNETDAEYQARAATYLKSVRTSLESSISKGLLVAFKDQQITPESITSGAQGVYELNRISEEQVMSGLGMQPAFFGRTDSTTETYADVVYSLLLAQVQNIQRLVKRRQERTYRLDFRIGGVPVDGVSVVFNRTFSRNRTQEAAASRIEVNVALEKAKHGIISPDDAARELGYESAYDPAVLEQDQSLASAFAAARAGTGVTSFAFRFDKASQRYKYRPPQTNTGGAATSGKAENIVPFQKKKRALQP
ncbi:MAG TPA: hypothetical protein VMM38_01365 [Aridibacter sp.]|nr:hypothetical protein [Aridibacter sp.]